MQKISWWLQHRFDHTSCPLFTIYSALTLAQRFVRFGESVLDRATPKKQAGLSGPGSVITPTLVGSALGGEARHDVHHMCSGVYPPSRLPPSIWILRFFGCPNKWIPGISTTVLNVLRTLQTFYVHFKRLAYSSIVLHTF